MVGVWKWWMLSLACVHVWCSRRRWGSKRKLWRPNFGHWYLTCATCIDLAQHKYVFAVLFTRSRCLFLDVCQMGASLIAASGKLRLLDRLLRKCHASNRRVLLFSQYTLTLDVLTQVLHGGRTHQ